MLRVWARSGGNVAAAQRLAVAQAEHERRRALGDHQAVGRGARHDGDGIGAVHLFQRGADRVEERRRHLAQSAVDEVGDDLGIGIGGEAHAFRFQRLSQRDVIFDDAV